MRLEPRNREGVIKETGETIGRSSCTIIDKLSSILDTEIFAVLWHFQTLLPRIPDLAEAGASFILYKEQQRPTGTPTDRHG